VCAVGLSCLLLCACADTGGNDRSAYVVRPHDTLYSIAWRYNLDFHDLARWNHIGPDFRIVVGQTLLLEGSTAHGSAHASVSGAAARPPPPPAAAYPQAQHAIPSAMKWVWPTEPISAPLPVPGQGILIAGQLGQDIRAACAGRVVYAGTGIRGYGDLIIIKHGEDLLSAYAHNRESLVQDGQDVALGQLIAHMGEATPQRPLLYFEIRRGGKPIDPTVLLPKLK